MTQAATLCCWPWSRETGLSSKIGVRMGWIFALQIAHPAVVAFSADEFGDKRCFVENDFWSIAALHPERPKVFSREYPLGPNVLLAAGGFVAKDAVCHETRP